VVGHYGTYGDKDVTILNGDLQLPISAFHVVHQSCNLWKEKSRKHLSLNILTYVYNLSLTYTVHWYNDAKNGW